MKEIVLVFIFMGPVAIIAQTLEITNGPMDTTVCIGSIVNIPCGFVNDSVNFTPNWRIIRRSNNGSVTSNMSSSGSDINDNVNDRLEYIPDTTSGPLMSPNSRLVVGPVDETDNQSSYQCVFAVAGDNVESDVGTLTVTGIPAVENLTAVDDCTSVTVSWDITDEGPCKDLSYDVVITSLDDGVILQSNTTNTNHTFTGVETSNETFNVNVTPFNENATGSSHTEIANVNVSSIDLPSLHASTACVTSLNISWNAFNITCRDIFYEVSVFQSSIGPRMEQFTRIGDIFYSNITGLYNGDRNVTVTVTAIIRAGQGNTSIVKTVRLLSSMRPPPINVTVFDTTTPAPINNVTVSNITTPSNLSGYDIFIVWIRPVINNCTTLPFSNYTINAFVTFMNGSQKYYASNNINDTSGDSMGRFNVSYNDSFDEELMPNATYNFSINSDNIEIPPSSTPTTMPPDNDDDDDDDNTGAIVGGIVGGIVVVTSGSTVTFFFVWFIWWRPQKKSSKQNSLVQPGSGLEMNKQANSSDVYDSPNKQEDPEKSAAQEQSLYSYARTGPINVVVPGGSHSHQSKEK